MRIRQIIKRIIIYFALTLLAFILQTSVFPLIRFLWTAPNLMLIVTFSYGLIYGSSTGIICGVFAGLLMDLFYAEHFGLFILLFSCLGYFSGCFKENFRTDSLLLPFVICLICDVIYNMAMIVYRLFMAGDVDIYFVLVKMTFPEMFFTMVVTVVAYRILLTVNRGLDRLDNLRGQNAA